MPGFPVPRVAVEERERWLNTLREYRCSLEVSENCLLVGQEKETTTRVEK